MLRRSVTEESLYQAAEQAAAKNGQGTLLHYAVASRCSFSVLAMLLAVNPDSLRKKDGAGRLPVDLLPPHQWKCGDFAKKDGEVGKLIMSPNDSQHVRLEFSGGAQSGYIEVSTLEPATQGDFAEIRHLQNDFAETTAICRMLQVRRLLVRGDDGSAPAPDVEHLLYLFSRQKQATAAHTLITLHRAKGTVPVEEGKDSAYDAGRHSDDFITKKVFEQLGAYLGRYQIEAGPPVHRSATCEVVYALDLRLNYRQVALKFMKQSNSLEAEVQSRHISGHRINEAVVEVLGWHTPEGNMVTDGHGKAQEPQHTPCSYNPHLDSFRFVLSMERAERSLHDACNKERFAGLRVPAIQQVVRHIASCLQRLHQLHVCHGDCKQRNIVRLGDRWILCDMDAATKLEEPIGEKNSTAYCPPELAQILFTRDNVLPLAHPSFDVWSFGVVLFELCAGHSLFNQDTSNDNLIDELDKTRLCTWHTMSDEELRPVLAAAEADFGRSPRKQTIEDAKNLIRWCLKAEPSARPTMEEILAHRFLVGADAPPPAPRRMLYHAFMSHAQADASGTVAAMYYAYLKWGLHNWIDMRQETLTLEGMKQGVRDSDVFLLLLSRHVLASWFCQQEILTAIQHRKKIQLLIEEEERFFPFDVEAWKATEKPRSDVELEKQIAGLDRQIEELRDQALKAVRVRDILAEHRAYESIKALQLQQESLNSIKGASGKRMVNAAWGGLSQVPPAICKMIDDNLSDAVTYRRRDYETESMMAELCARNKIVLPCQPMVLPAHGGQPLRVFVISNREHNAGAATIVGDLMVAMQSNFSTHIELTDDETALSLSEADRVLLLLSSGVLEVGRTQLRQLLDVLTLDENKHDRLVAVYSEEAGWSFGCAEQKAACKEVQDALNDHEAITYRPKTQGRLRHEFPVMTEQLVMTLCRPCNDRRAQ